MARSGSYISGRNKLTDEVKTALSGLRRDLDGVPSGRLINFCSESMTGGSTVYLHPWHSTAAGSATERWTLVPFACTARGMYVWCETAGTGSGTVIYTVRRNSADTSLVVKIPATGTSGQNTIDSIKFEPGDRISVKVTDSGTVSASPDMLSVTIGIY